MFEMTEQFKKNWLGILLALIAGGVTVILVTGDHIPGPVQNLLSGLLGSLIGAGAVVWATSRQIKAVAEQNKVTRKEDEDARFLTALTALREEIRLNSFPEAPINEALAIFMTDAWEAFKPYAHRLDTSVITSLTRAYTKAHSHRSAIQFGVAGVHNPYGGTASLLLREAMSIFKQLHSDGLGI